MDPKVQRGKLAERKKETFLQRFKIEKKRGRKSAPRKEKAISRRRRMVGSVEGEEKVKEVESLVGGGFLGSVRRREDTGSPYRGWDQISLRPSLSPAVLPGPDVGIAKHCRVMSVITPTTAAGRPGGPYGRPSWLGSRALGPREARCSPTCHGGTPSKGDRVPSRPNSNG